MTTTKNDDTNKCWTSAEADGDYVHIAQIAPIFFAIVSFNSLFAVFLSVIQGILVPTTLIVPDPDVATSTGAAIGVLSFFTILSNVLVGVAAGAYAMRPSAMVTSRRYAWLFYTTLTMISITGAVYAIVLRPLSTSSPSQLDALQNACLHYIAPSAFLIGWLLFGPRWPFRLISMVSILIIPVIWAIYTLIRGSIIHWYPYAFLNVDNNGLGRVLLNIAIIFIIAVLLSALFQYLSSLLASVPALNPIYTFGDDTFRQSANYTNFGVPFGDDGDDGEE